MITIEDTAKTIEHTVYLLMVMRDYCKANDHIIEIMPIKHALEDTLKYIDKMHAKLIDNNIL